MLGFDAVATGHHARVVRSADGSARIGRGAERAKDQSYVLYPVRAAELDRVLFPIGGLTKRDVRGVAAELGLRTADKPESQDVCFVTRSAGRGAFLAARGQLHPGVVVDETGRTVGDVAAVELVTVGQRRGLDLAGGHGRRFVTDVDVSAGTVTVGPPEALVRAGLELDSMVWADEPVAGLLRAQSSAHGSVADAEVTTLGDERAELRWVEPRRRVAPGQSVVLYADRDGVEVVVGGGLAR